MALFLMKLMLRIFQIWYLIFSILKSTTLPSLFTTRYMKTPPSGTFIIIRHAGRSLPFTAQTANIVNIPPGGFLCQYMVRISSLFPISCVSVNAPQFYTRYPFLHGFHRFFKHFPFRSMKCTARNRVPVRKRLDIVF